jgi:hypothetical protein
MKSLLATMGAILAALICAATGAYVLRHYSGTAGLAVGVALVLLGLAIALPTQLRKGSMTFKDSVVVVVEQAEDALKGGSRHTDPPADKGTG